MSRSDYIAVLRRALAEQQPPVSLDIAAKTVAWYDKQFVDGAAAGRSEASIADDLGDPLTIAATLNDSMRAGTASAYASTADTGFSSYSTNSPSSSTSNSGSPSSAAATSATKPVTVRRHPAHAFRVVGTAIGLSIFNLFMVIPALVCASLLATLYAASLGFYIGGIAITASGLSGANELVLDGPVRAIMNDIERDWGNKKHPNLTRITITDAGIKVLQEPAPGVAAVADTGPRAKTKVEIVDGNTGERIDVLGRAGQYAGNGISITTDSDEDSRTTQAVFGMSMVVGAILLFLVCLVLTRYSLVGIKRYAQMNYSLLKGH